MDDYKDLRKTYEYNRAKATRLAEAMNEARVIEKRLDYLKKIADDNDALAGFLWETVDNVVIAYNDLTRTHLENILALHVRQHMEIPPELRAEAESRDIDVDAIEGIPPNMFIEEAVTVPNARIMTPFGEL